MTRGLRSRRRTLTALAAGLALVVAAPMAGPTLAGAASADTSVAPPARTDTARALKNLAHLNWLGATVTPPA